MRLLGRTFAILFAALLVAGATYALGGGSLTGWRVAQKPVV